MSKGWDPGSANAGCTGKSSHLATHVPYDWPPVGRPNVAYMRASGAQSSTREPRWTLRMEADVEVVVVHLRLAADGPSLAVVPVSTCSMFL